VLQHLLDSVDGGKLARKFDVADSHISTEGYVQPLAVLVR